MKYFLLLKETQVVRVEKASHNATLVVREGQRDVIGIGVKYSQCRTVTVERRVRGTSKK